MVLDIWTQQYQIIVMEAQCVILILFLKIKVFNTENCLFLKKKHLPILIPRHEVRSDEMILVRVGEAEKYG
jgi:hypothetical protein